MILHDATKIANELLDSVSNATSRAEIAGSIRRKKPTVKDIELVITVDNYADLYNRLSKHGRFIKPGVPEIIDWPPKTGAKYIRMLLDQDVKLDVFVATPNNWGGILMLRTGSGVDDKGSSFNGFSSGMLQRWKKISNGGKMINGQLTLPNGDIPNQQEESNIFDLVNLGWIPPELRTSKKIFKEFLKQ